MSDDWNPDAAAEHVLQILKDLNDDRREKDGKRRTESVRG